MTDPFAVLEPDDVGKVKRNRYGQYLLPELEHYTLPASKTEIGWTRATTFAKSISDTYTLSMWQQRMAIVGLSIRPDLYARVCATDPKDKDSLDSLVNDAKEAAEAKASANLGTALHSFTEMLDRGQTPNVPGQWEKDVQAYSDTVNQWGLEILEIERIVIAPDIQVAGTFDRIVELQKDVTVTFPGEIPYSVALNTGDRVILDLKTGRDLSYGWNEIVIQQAIYAGAKGMWDPIKLAYDPMPKSLSQDVAFILHLPVGKGKGTLYAVRLDLARAAISLCAKVREWRKTRHMAVALSVAEETKVREPTLYEQIDAITTKDQLLALYRGSKLAGWTDEHTEYGKKHLAKFATP